MYLDSLGSYPKKRKVTQLLKTEKRISLVNSEEKPNSTVIVMRNTKIPSQCLLFPLNLCP